MSSTISSTFLFSVIMPVYNVEDYLDEAVQSILSQSIGFKNNVELVFVDDGSTDNSAKICQKYKNLYPDRVKFIQQKNQGPAIARDKGAAAAEGKYLSFLDSDDKLSKNALRAVYDFFEAHYDEIDIVTIPWEYFEARVGRDHPLNYKFYKDRVIDLETDYTETVGSVAPSFFKAEVFKKHTSNPKVGKYAEDLRFMGEALLDKKKFGVVCGETYYYRKRHSQTSSQDGNSNDVFFYLQTPKTAVASLLDYAEKKEGSVPKFIQFMVAYEIQWRFKRYGADILNSEQVKEYQAILESILKRIDDDILLHLGNSHAEHKVYMLDVKHDFAKRAISQQGSELRYNDTLIESNYNSGCWVHVDFIEEDGDDTVLELNYLGLADEIKLYAMLDGKKYIPTSADRKSKKVKMFVDKIIEYPSRGYNVTIPTKLLYGKKIQFFIEQYDQPLRVSTRRFSGLSQKNTYSYAVRPHFMMLKQRDGVKFVRRSGLLHVLLEIRYMTSILFRVNGRLLPQSSKLQQERLSNNGSISQSHITFYETLRQTLYTPALLILFARRHGLKSTNEHYIQPLYHQVRANIYSTVMRILYYLTKPYYSRKNIWMFMDRTFEGDDSAEILFEYTIAQKNADITPVFTIKQDSPDFSRIGKIGWTVPFLSQKQKILFLHSKKMISSHADDVMINPFMGLSADMNDLYRFDYIFLQHGIIKDDISDWLHRYNKNIKLFVTSVRGEYQSLFDYQYFYDESVVKLTGLPRYDKLENNPEKKIALVPTWRNHLASIAEDADRGHSEEFKNTYYYKYYQSLISHSRLNKALKQYGYTMQFCIHPAFREQYVDFKPGESVEVKKLPYDYKKLKSTSKLMITDFSSVVFDFAYLRKPIIYTQFDEDIYWKSHMSSPGYFSYRKDGLGPVLTDLESTVDAIVGYIKNDCKLEKKYADRIEKFFAFDDKNNAKRVYDAILEQDKEVKKAVR